MENKTILLPICGQVLLTFIVWLWMYVTRIGAIQRSGADVQELADESRSQTILGRVVNPSDNLENLFELPVLFYVAMIVLFVSGLADHLYLMAAWGFVIFRAVHSLIHCTYNKIMHRFSVYAISSLILWGIWLRISLQLL